LPTQETIQALNSWANWISFAKTEQYQVLDKLPHRCIALFAGNRSGKTASVAKHYVDRLIGKASVPYKNKLMGKVRCMSSSLPESNDPDVTDNAQYIELRRLIPSEMIIKDVTARSANLVVRRPVGLSSKKTVFEFRSSKQEMQDLGKINLSSLWHDEETPDDKRTECAARLMQEDGDEIFSITTTNPYSYCYDDVFVPASYVYRTKKVVAHTGEERVEKRLKGNTDIACIIMSTYDNPTLSEDAIQRMIDKCADPVQVDLRIYGTFRQASGRIHKTYNPKYCFIPFTRYFPDGIPYEWFHCRGIDYHESRTPWSVGWMALSPTNEAFLWQEFHPAIDGPNAYNTYDICKTIARNSQEFIYTVNLIDALANKKQANSGFSTTDDMNRHFHEMRRTSGIGAQCFWEGWNTKGTTGRDNVSLRFKNAVRCGKPFNNKVREAGRVSYLPTLWICDTAPKFHHSIMNWRYGEYVTSTTRAVNDPKNVPMQKNSHDCCVLEALFKDSRVQNASHFMKNRPPLQGVRRRSVTGR